MLTLAHGDPLPDGAFTVRGHSGIAFRLNGWETYPDRDTEWSGIEVFSGNILAHMIGDDRIFSFDPSDITPLAREDYCSECGAIGCTHDGYERG